MSDATADSRGAAGLAALIALAVAWGVFAFGAVYAWAYWPLLALALVAGVGGLTSCAPTRLRGRIALAALVVVPVAVQLVPLPRAVLAAVAPGNARVISKIDLAYALAGGSAWHELSVNPGMTIRSLIFLTIGAVWIAGVSAVLASSRSMAGRLATAIAATGAAVAIVGLAQKALFNGKIYWFWESPFKLSFNYFGPFVNRNHFAGWMLLAVSLSAGCLLGRISSSRAGRTARERLLWIGTREAHGLVLLALGIIAMVVSIVWTLSRSGMASLAVVFLIIAVAGVARGERGWSRLIVPAAVMLTIGAAAAWKGTDTVGASYRDTQSLEWRLALWHDTVAPLRDAWTTGVGLNAYGTAMLVYPQTDTHVHAEQAHNDYLQLAVEGGALAGVPWLAAMALLARIAWRRLRQPQPETTWWIRMGAVAGICGMAVQESSEFSLQIPGVALLFGVLVATAIHESPRVNGGSSSRRVRT